MLGRLGHRVLVLETLYVLCGLPGVDLGLSVQTRERDIQILDINKHGNAMFMEPLGLPLGSSLRDSGSA